VVVALGTFSLGLGKSADLLLFFPEDYDVLSFVRKPGYHLVASVAGVSALGAGHEDLLLLLGGKKGRPAFWAKLQNAFSPE
jgi:hypothetical protein